MSMKDKLQKFNQRWSITTSEPYEVSFKKFKTRILNIFKEIDYRVTEEGVALFCQVFGISEHWEHDMYGDRKWSTNITDRLKSEENEIEFYKLIEVIFALPIPGLSGYSGEMVYSKESMYREVCAAIALSDVNLETTVTKDGEIIFYPKGEAFLDADLVDKALSFLNKESNAHFVESLKFYQVKKHIKSAESLRRSLEEFLHFKLQNTKGLDANFSDLTNRLKTGGKDPQVRNIILQACRYLDQYFNENSKHNDGDIDDSENEFLIYQTGVLMRYLDKSL
ncbi:hypothetical protein KBC54_01340 [Patescibacteria group bacterium]|nr:hypothetical protein [Patescibacteria group bacterium]